MKTWFIPPAPSGTARPLHLQYPGSMSPTYAPQCDGALPTYTPVLGMEPCDSATSAIEARLVSPSASDFVVHSVPPRVHADRPLELELAAVGHGAGAGAELSTESWISAHALLQIAVDIPGQAREAVALPVTARPSCGGWTIRALARPSAWTDAAFVTVVSLSLAGRPLPCEFLPATLRVGYNHAPAPKGAVYEAARAGDVPALWAAIEAGGSTEEANEVRELGWGTHGGHVGEGRACKTSPAIDPLPFPPHLTPQHISLCCSTPRLPPTGPPTLATLRPFARSW